METRLCELERRTRCALRVSAPGFAPWLSRCLRLPTGRRRIQALSSTQSSCTGELAVGGSASRASIRASKLRRMLLTRREERVVMRAAGRELDDANGVVSIAMAACVGGRLVERPQAIAVPPKPRHTGHLPRGDAPWEPDGRPGSALCRRNVGPRLSSRACTTTGSSRVPTRRSTGGRPGPADRPTGRARRGVVRSSPSGTDRGTGRSGRRCGGPTRSARRRVPRRQ